METHGCSSLAGFNAPANAHGQTIHSQEGGLFHGLAACLCWAHQTTGHLRERRGELMAHLRRSSCGGSPATNISHAAAPAPAMRWQLLRAGRLAAKGYSVVERMRSTTACSCSFCKQGEGHGPCKLVQPVQCLLRAPWPCAGLALWRRPRRLLHPRLRHSCAAAVHRLCSC